MKEYKLKKWYPSLPQSWKNKRIIVVQRQYGYNLHPSLNTLLDETIRFTEVNNPEFWQEVLPKRFEILSFESRSSGYKGGVMYTTLRPNGKYLNSNYPNDDGHYELDFVLAQPHWNISKVKRLSDGEVFTVGDVVVRHVDENCDTPNPAHRKITKFYVEENDPDMMFKSGKEEGFIIDLFSHIKPDILFRTEDGVYAYKGFAVYQVSLVDKDYSMHLTEARVELTPVPSYFKYFSTRQAAEDFIIRKKPVLSAAEIDDLARSFVGSYNIEFHIALNKLTKKKLGF